MNDETSSTETSDTTSGNDTTSGASALTTATPTPKRRGPARPRHSNTTSAWAEKKGWKQIVIWGPVALRENVRRAARRAGVGMSEYMRAAIEAGLAAHAAAAKKKKGATT